MNKIWRIMGNMSRGTRFTLLALMAAMTVEGVRTFQNQDAHDAEPENKPDAAAVVVNTPPAPATPEYAENTYGAYLAKMRAVTPLLIADLILPEGVCMENGKHVVYDDKVLGRKLKPGEKAKGLPTIGFGSTVLDGKRVTSYTRPITTEKAYENARRHIEDDEIYFLMYCYEIGVPAAKIQDTGTALMLGSALYNLGSKLIEEPRNRNHCNRFELLRQARKQYGDALPDSVVRDAFEKYPVVAPTSFGKVFLGQEDGKITDAIGNFLKGGTGLIWRRWIEAGLASGQIKAEELLDVPLGTVPEFFFIMKKKFGGNDKKAFWTERNGQRYRNDATIDAWREWIRNPVDRHGNAIVGAKKVSDVLPADIIAQCRSGKCEIADDVKKSHADIYAMGMKMLGNSPYSPDLPVIDWTRGADLFNQ